MRRFLVPNAVGLSGGDDAIWNGGPSRQQLINQGSDAAQNYVKNNPDAKALVAEGLGVLGSAGGGAKIGAFIGSIFGLEGAAVGAIVGAVVGAVIALIPIIGQFLGSSCSITLLGNTIDCRDYPGIVVNGSANWIKSNIAVASKMAPQELSNMTGIYVDTQTAAEVIGYANTLNNDDLNVIKQLPGARELLATVQIPVATALAVSAPGLLPLFKVTFPANFPALRQEDIDAIVAHVQPMFDGVMADAQAWANHQCPRPGVKAIEDKFGLLPPNAEDVFNHWLNFNCGLMLLGRGGDGGSAPTSTTSKVVTGTAVAGGVAIGAVWLYSLWKGYTFFNAARGVWKDVKAVGHKLEFKHHNPMQLGDGSATRGRKAAYRLWVQNEDIRVDRAGAIFVRQGRAVRFRPSNFQLAKIRRGDGEILIFTDQLL